MSSKIQPNGKTLGELGHEHAKRLIEEALKRSNGSVVEAAKFLGISRITIWRRMKRYGLVGGEQA